jgi:hypothetical protein
LPGSGVVLARIDREFRMFRAIALSIVLTLAAEPTAAQLCKALCSSPTAGATVCRHDASTTQPSVTSNSNCTGAASSVGAFFREEIERRGAVSHASHAVCALQYHVPLLTANGDASQQAAHHWSLASRPLTTALRI